MSDTMSPSKARSVLAVKWSFCPVPCKVLLECLQKFPNPPAVQVLPSFPTVLVAAGGPSLRLKNTLEKLPEGPCPQLLGEFQHLLSLWVPLPNERPWETRKCSRFQTNVWETRQSRTGSQRNSSVSNLFSLFWWNLPL